MQNDDNRYNENAPKVIDSKSVVLKGIPYDGGSSFMRGPALAPARIREIMASGVSNLCCEGGIDLSREHRFIDAGDLVFKDDRDIHEQIEIMASDVIAQGGYLLSLGGDHAVTYPLVKAFAGAYPDLTVVDLDAHPDLYDQYGGDRFSHACTFARVMEEGLVRHLVQVGIRTMTPEQQAQAERFGVEVIDMNRWERGLRPVLQGPVYLSIDMDVLDPAFAPGVSHHEPGGLTTREVLRLIQYLDGKLVGADLVEYNPKRDQTGVTAMIAFKLIKEITGKMLLSKGSSSSGAR
jgi:agmatinase